MKSAHSLKKKKRKTMDTPKKEYFETYIRSTTTMSRGTIRNSQVKNACNDFTGYFLINRGTFRYICLLKQGRKRKLSTVITYV